MEGQRRLSGLISEYHGGLAKSFLTRKVRFDEGGRGLGFDG